MRENNCTLPAGGDAGAPPLMTPHDLAGLLRYSSADSLRVILHRAARDRSDPILTALASAKIRIGRRAYWRRADVYRILGLAQEEGQK